MPERQRETEAGSDVREGAAAMRNIERLMRRPSGAVFSAVSLTLALVVLKADGIWDMNAFVMLGPIHLVSFVATLFYFQIRTRHTREVDTWSTSQGMHNDTLHEAEAEATANLSVVGRGVALWPGFIAISLKMTVYPGEMSSWFYGLFWFIFWSAWYAAEGLANGWIWWRDQRAINRETGARGAGTGIGGGGGGGGGATGGLRAPASRPSNGRKDTTTTTKKKNKQENTARDRDRYQGRGGAGNGDGATEPLVKSARLADDTSASSSDDEDGDDNGGGDGFGDIALSARGDEMT